MRFSYFPFVASIVLELYQKRKINCEPFVSETHYETVMGSESYGVSNNTSDIDIYGFVIPPKEYLFYPNDYIIGFKDKEFSNFEQFQQHHIQDGDKEYDIQVFNIAKYFQLCMENNPNMVDSLYTPQRCLKHISKIGELVRANRKIFLHKAEEKNYNKIAEILYRYDITEPPEFKDIELAKEQMMTSANQQLLKIEKDDLIMLLSLYREANKVPSIKRLKTVMKYGWDVKFGYHVIRLSDEAEQILVHGTIDLERSKDMMKAVRNGEMSLIDVKRWFQEKEIQLEKLYHESNAVPHSPDVKKIKALLLNCVEDYYGSLSILQTEDRAKQVIADIVDSIRKAGF